jgi:16S rRNA (uracil1498-N3)-methyltransferase
MRRFFIPPEKINGTQALLGSAEAHHLRTVMRLGPGDSVVVFDGAGHHYQAVIRSSSNSEVLLELTEKKTAEPCEGSDIALAQGFLKDKKMDTLVRPLTELGLTRWIPFRAHRSIPAPDARRLTTRLNRWRKLSIEAMKQCRRDIPLEIDVPGNFEEVLAQSQPYGLKLLFWEKAESAPALETLAGRSHERVFILIGPEGGLEDAEVAAAQTQGFHILGMGPRILRAETAALAACVLAQYLWGDMKLSPQDG